MAKKPEAILIPAKLRKNHYGQFRMELEDLINKCSIENGSNTPDYILTDYLLACLKAFDNAVSKRTTRLDTRVR